ncbi:MAG: hypothetical protein AAGC93_21485 [Cyanobacteria bacterium P01_F01_bin.53]
MRNQTNRYVIRLQTYVYVAIASSDLSARNPTVTLQTTLNPSFHHPDRGHRRQPTVTHQTHPCDPHHQTSSAKLRNPLSNPQLPVT